MKYAIKILKQRIDQLKLDRQASLEHEYHDRIKGDDALIASYQLAVELLERTPNNEPETLDLMVDEFQRIKNLTEKDEIKGLCDRAMSQIRQHVSLIGQRDKLATDLCNVCDMLNKLPDLNLQNYTHDDVCNLQHEVTNAVLHVRRLIAQKDEWVSFVNYLSPDEVKEQVKPIIEWIKHSNDYHFEHHCDCRIVTSEAECSCGLRELRIARKEALEHAKAKGWVE